MNKAKAYQIMEDWARNRGAGECMQLGAYNSVLGRALSGMPSNKCVKCNGTGKRNGLNAKQRKQIFICKICKGKGKVNLKTNNSKINPAFIPATGEPVGDNEAIHMSIDDIVYKLPRLQQAVVKEEFLGIGGRQEAKAARIWVIKKQRPYLNKKSEITKKGITQGYYARVLTNSLSCIWHHLVKNNFVKGQGSG